MPIKNYTTSIPADKTIGEIQSILRKHGARKIILDYQEIDGVEEAAITFNLPGPGDIPIYFSLRAHWRGVLKKIAASGKVPSRLRNEEHALNVAWRIQKDWLDAQIAIVESGLQTMDEAFFSKAITAKGSTIYEEVVKTTEGRLLLSENL